MEHEALNNGRHPGKFCNSAYRRGTAKKRSQKAATKRSIREIG